jgi:hypothetical protein
MSGIKGKSGVYKRTKPMWNKGIPCRPETKEKLSKKSKGKHLSPKSEFKKGMTPWNKGLKGKQKNHNTSGLQLGRAWNKGLPHLAIRGSNHHSWKGGVTPANEASRKSLEMRLWKKACMERDNFTCQKTGQRGVKLVIHHINNFADFTQLRTAIDNGITLSRASHIEFHKIYGKKNNTREQLNEFLNK